MSSQMPNLIHVTEGSCHIKYKHATMEMSGVSGTHGTRKGRTRSGSMRRRKITPAETSTNANSVPMLVRSTTSAMFANAANTATNTPVRMVPTYGVLYLG